MSGPYVRRRDLDALPDKRSAETTGSARLRAGSALSVVEQALRGDRRVLGRVLTDRDADQLAEVATAALAVAAVLLRQFEDPTALPWAVERARDTAGAA